MHRCIGDQTSHHSQPLSQCQLVDWPLLTTDFEMTILATRLTELFLLRPILFFSSCPALTRNTQLPMVRMLTPSSLATCPWVIPPRTVLTARLRVYDACSLTIVDTLSARTGCQSGNGP